jgi:hypothetical protein
MTASEAIANLTAKADPCETNCLRCCAKLRCALIALARLDIRRCETFDVTLEEVDEEVARLLALHPELSTRFGPNGCPKGGTCPELSAG